MLYNLFDFLSDSVYSGFNVFRYITFRSALAAMTALAISWFVGPFIIRKLTERQIQEDIREDGPESHFAKQGTPTMGGLIIIPSILIPALLWADLSNIFVQLILFTTVWMGTVGFIDDYIKVMKKEKAGLHERYKLAGQITLGLILGLIIYFHPQFEGISTLTTVPFFKNFEINLGYMYVPMVIFIITATSNAVNITDGLDGLATGVSTISMLAFAGIAYMTGHVAFSDYLNILYMKGSGELAVFCMAVVGAGLGFLWYNSYPAQVFMGDTGSLALGGIFGGLAILLKKELLLPIVAGIFVIEMGSVVVQRYYFKYTRKRTGTGQRVFLMAPLHHHFEKKGWPENKIVARFWIISVILVLATLATFKVR